MMSTLRKNTATILWVLVFAFIATIVFSWGMGGFKGRIEPGVIAKVNGVKITREQYEQALQNRMSYERQNANGELPESKVTQIRTEVWDGLINELILDQARKKAGVTVTDQEVAMAVQQNPPPAVMQNPQLQDSTGKFDWNLYHTVLADPSNVDFVIAVEKTVRQQLLQQKMLQRIGSLNHISEDEAKDYYVRENSKAKASFILIPFNTMTVDTSLITEEKLQSAYHERQEDFKVDPARVVEYITIPDMPSREDSLDALHLANTIKTRIEKGESFADLAKEYSDDPSGKNGGDLGWFTREKMVKPFADAAFDNKVGSLVGPVQTRFGYHIVKVEGRRVNKEGKEEVHASHILIRVEKSPETEEDLNSRADGFQQEARDNGFVEAAKVYNLKIDTLEHVSKTGFNPFLRRNRAARDFLFNRPVGDISPVYKLSQGYVVMRSIKAIKAGYKPFDEVRQILTRDLLKDMQFTAADAEANKVYGLVKEKGLEQAAQENGYKVEKTSNYFKVGEYVKEIGRDNHFTLEAFAQKPGEISKPVKGDKGYYIIRTDEKDEASLDKWEDTRDQVIAQLANTRQRALYNDWLAQAKKDAKVKDYRYLYFTDY